MTKTVKKSVAFLSAAVMFMAMLLYFPGGTFSNIDWGLKASAATTITESKPATGDGSESNPYQISNANELYWFAGLVNGTLDGVTQNTAAWAKLTANITVNNNVLVDGALNTTNSGSFTSWTPIGNSYSSQYTGTFDGQNNTISGLYFDDSNTRYVGLFGYVGSGGNVSNVGIVDSYFNGNRYAGGVCGNNYGTIKNCYNTGAVSGNDYHAGGVCGNNDGTIQNCYNTGAVSGKWKVGGVCGYNYNSTIQNCYSTGTVSGWSDIGGVCGYNDGSTITNCYFDSDNYSGEAVGHIYSGTITYVEGKTTNAFEKGEVCYLLQSGQEKDSGSGEAPMVWGQTIGTDKAPVLTSDSKKTVYLIDGTYSNTNSEITEKEHNFGADFRCTNCGNYEAPELNENVYEITNASQLYWFAEYVNNGNTSAEAILKENIVVNENVLGADGKLVSDTSKFVSWTPIGSVSNKYTGTFDGNGKTISGLYLYNGDKSYVGLFGYVGSGGNISNVGVVASYFKGKNNVGGVCGYNYSPIKNCYNTGAVNGSENVGGVCGYNYSTIQNCYSTGGVSGNDQVGGVCGFNEGGTIENCYSTGGVSGNDQVGGVCGWNYAIYGGTATITNCYNTGAVSGSSNVGGVCGYNSGEITNCYNTGAVSGSSNVGGVCGTNDVATIKNCYYDSTVYRGRAIGENHGNVENVEGKATKQFESGEVCYLLNKSTTDGSPVWYQTIDSGTKDAYPNLDSTNSANRTVYASDPCPSKFSNTNNVGTAEHSYVVDTNDNTNHVCKNCGETHNAKFTADDTADTISICCDSDKVTLKAPTENLTYDGTAKEATVTGAIEGFTTPKILYKLKDVDETATETAPVNAGTYVASITYTDADYNKHSVSVEYTIEKAELTVEAGTYKVSKEYDETTGAGTGSGTLSVSGIINDDDVTVKVDSVGEYSASDVGNDYKVAVAISLSGDKADNYTLGTVSSINVPAAITKAEQTADVIDPVVEKFDCCSVTLAKVDGYEYSMDGETWQDSNVFIGLTAGTKYTFYQRIKATANYEASANSTGVLQTTSKHDYSDENAKPEAFYKKATCTSPAVYYFSCSKCGDVEGDSTHTFTNGSTLEHNDTDNDGYCNNGCGKLIHSVVKEVSATLDGDIGLNYYIALPESVTADTGAYVQFTVNGQNTKVFVKDVTDIEGSVYKFTCWLTAKEMSDDVTFKLYDGNGTLIDIYSNSGDKVEGASFDYSLETYLNTLSSDENAALKDLADATLVYGAYAQNAFNHNADPNLDGSELADVTVGTLEANKITKSADIPEGLKLTEMTLILETETTLRLYFKSDNIGNYTFKLDGNDVTLNTIAEEGLYYVEIANISAKDLDTKHTLIINDNCELTFNALSYAYATVKAGMNENICNVVKALYKYNDAANAYFGE